MIVRSGPFYEAVPIRYPRGGIEVGVGDSVVVEAPTYSNLLPLLSLHRARIRAVPIGPQGVELAELERIVPRLPRRLTIVSAGDPMWRGGLSAPSSLYIHAARPLVSENGTSTKLHEVMHIALGLRAGDGNDWIIEGLAEYFSLELLRRSGTFSKSRHDRARAAQEEWSKSSTRLCGDTSTGATTARAVAVFIELDEELQQASEGTRNLDDVVSNLRAANTDIDIDFLIETVSAILGKNPDALHIDNLPGCRKIAADDKQP